MTEQSKRYQRDAEQAVGTRHTSSSAEAVRNGLSQQREYFLCYGIGRDAFNQGKNAKYNMQIDENLMPTVIARGPGGVCMHVIAYEGQGCNSNSTTAYTLCAGRVDDHHITVVCHERR